MDIKLFRNVLTTTTLVSALLIPVSSVAFADEKENLNTQVQQTETNIAPDVVTPDEIAGEHVQQLSSYGTSNLGTFNNLDAALTAIIESAKTFESTVSFTYTGSLANIKAEMTTAINNALTLPGNDYLHGTLQSWQYSYTSSGNFKMEFKYHATPEQENYVTGQVKAIAASLARPGMSELDKVRAVNDYVVTHTVYSNTSKTTPHHIYAYLTEGKAVCQAYALLTYRLLTEMGIESRYVVGDAGGPHAWNSVKIDGVWYHLDTTWNDSTFNGFDTLTNIGYRYFLVTSETLRKDHTWDEDFFPVATDNRYSYYHNISMGIEHNNEIYYRDATNYTLNKLNPLTGSSSSLVNHRVAYLAAHNEFIYYSNFSNGGYLTSYNLFTGATEVLDASTVSQLDIVDGYLNYKVGTKVKSYQLPVSVIEQEVRNVEMTIQALSEFSSQSDLTAARDAYTALTDEQKASIVNLSKLEKLEEVYPVNLAAATAVANAAKNYTTSSNRSDLLTVIAQFDALTAAQQALVSNKDTVLAFRSAINAQNGEIQAVEQAITALKSTSKTYLADIIKIREAYDTLSEEQRSDVSNYSALQKIINDTASAQDAFYLIGGLDGSSVDAIIEARTAYNDVPAAFKKHVTNIKSLTAFESKVKNVTAAINAINAIDPASKKFVSQVTTARKAYDKTGSQQYLVTNSDSFLIIEAQAKVFDLINKLKPTSTKYIQEVTNAKTALDALGASTSFVTNKDKLSLAIEAIKPAQAVIAQIDALDGTSIVAIQDTRTAFTALDKTAQKYITNIKVLTAKENEVRNALAAVNAINAIDPASTKFVAQVTAARKAYDKAGSQQHLVTNSDSFLIIEAQAKVFDLINKLKPTSTKYIQEVTNAKTALDALGASTSFVTNKDKLSLAIEAIKPAQAVIAQIVLLDGTAVSPVLEARAAYTNLSATSKKYVTNLKDLVAVEKKLAAPLKVIDLINITKKTDITTSSFLSKALTMKKAYIALTGANKALVTNTDDYQYYVALYEVKNAQKVRKWADVSVDAFKTLNITGVTTDNLVKVIAGFNALKAGSGTSTVEEIQKNVTAFIAE